MTRQRLVLASIAVLALAAPAIAPAVRPIAGTVYAGDAPSGVSLLVAREGDSFLEEIDGQQVLHLTGDHHQMGVAHGKLLRQEVRECCDAYLRDFAYGRMHYTMEYLQGIYAKAKPHIPPELLDEMRGLSEGSGVPLEEIEAVHIIPELHHCSGAAVFGKMTADGKLYHYRSLDYSLELGTNKKVQENACLIVRKPAKGYASVVVGWAGTLGCVTGMNAEGISIGEMGSSSFDEAFDGTPMWFRLRWILENCRTLDEGLAGFRDWKRTCGYTFIIADGKIPDARAVEVDRNRVAIFSPGGDEENVAPHEAIPFAVRRTNHFVDPELAKRQRKDYDPRVREKGSFDAYERISDYLKANVGKLDMDGMVTLCRGYSKDHSCLHQAVFCPTDLKFRVANAKDPSHEKNAGAQNQTFFSYDLKALLAEDPSKLAPARRAQETVDGGKEPEKKHDTLEKSAVDLAEKLKHDARAVPADPAAIAKLLGGEPTGTASEPALEAKDDDEAVTRALLIYERPAGTFSFRLEQLKKLDDHVHYKVRFPSAVHTTDPSDLVEGNYYEPIRKGKDKDKKLPACVVVHHLGGGFEAEEFVAAYLADNGVAACTISLPGYGVRRSPGQPAAGFLGHDDPRDDLAGMRQAILDVRRAADFLRARPEVDGDRVGTLGISLGALVAADASGIDTRFARNVFVIGGGDFLKILKSGAPETKGVLDRAKAGGVTEETLKAGFDLVDPCTFARRLKADDVYMVNAKKDEIFPRESTLGLWRKAGYPKITWYDCTHTGIAVHLGEVASDALDHLKGKAPVRTPD